MNLNFLRSKAALLAILRALHHPVHRYGGGQRLPFRTVPKVFGEQIKATTPQYALYGFAIFYFVCLVLNWWFYLRPGAYVKNP